MKLLFVGQSYWNTGVLPYQSAYISEIRDVHLPAQMQKLGHTCSIATFGPDARSAKLWSGVQQLPLTTVQSLADFDAVILLDHSAALQMTHFPGLTHQAWAHPRLIVISDDDYPAFLPYYDRAFAIGSTTALLAAKMKRRFPQARHFLSTYGFEDYGALPLPPDPYPLLHKPILLFVGRMTERAGTKLEEIAQIGSQDWEVWIASLFLEGWLTGHQNECGNALSDAERSRFFPHLHFCSDVIPWVEGGGHGPIYRKDLYRFLYHARIGLNFVHAIGPFLYCKIYDYLAAGLPVLTEYGAPNSGDILQLHAGQIIDPSTWRDSISPSEIAL
jgi:hypothetical protein